MQKMKGSRVLKMTKCCWYRVTCSDSEHSWRNYLNERKTQHHTISAQWRGPHSLGSGEDCFDICRQTVAVELVGVWENWLPIELPFHFFCLNCCTVVMFEWDWSVIFKSRHCMRVALRFMIYWEPWVMSYEPHGNGSILGVVFVICLRHTKLKQYKLKIFQKIKKNNIIKTLGKLVIKNKNKIKL